MGVEALVSFHLDDMRVTEAEQMERAADGACVNRLPEPIQNKHGLFEYGIHHLSQSIASKLAESACRATEKLRKMKPMAEDGKRGTL
jgi:hypothetical protein